MAVCAAVFVIPSVRAESEVNGPWYNPEDQFRGIWHVSWNPMKDLFALGFNTVFTPIYGVNVKANFIHPNLDKTRQSWLRMAETNDAVFIESVSSLLAEKELRSVRYPIISPSGKKTEQIDMSIVAARKETLAWIERMAKSVSKDSPAFGGVSPSSEVHDRTYPKNTPDFEESWARHSGGKPMPKHENASVAPHYTAIEGFPINRVVDENYPLYDFYLWYWKCGDGWSDFQTESVRIYERVLGRKLLSFFDPAVRMPPVWGSGGKVSHLNQWTYIYPEPYGISYITAETAEMARGQHQRLLAMIQAISYRSQLAPAGKIPPNGEPAWAKRNPDAVYISTPPDMIREAMWTLFSHKVDGIFFHGWQSILDREDYNDTTVPGYCYTNDETKFAISNEFAVAGKTLGPLFKALPEATETVMIMESSAACFFARRCGWGYAGNYPHGDMATLAGFSPRVVYDEEIRRDGLPTRAKVLLLPNCDVLTRKTCEAIRKFQLAGGVVIADDNLSPAILPDAALPAFKRTREAARDTPALRKAAMELKALVGRYANAPAESNRDDVFVRVRQLPGADYLFAINDRRGAGEYVGQWGLVWEKGLPNSARVSVKRTAGAVYDLVKHCAVPFTVKDGHTYINLNYQTTDGRVLLVADKPLDHLTVLVKDGDVTISSPDKDVMIPIKIERKGAKPFYAVIKNGFWSRTFSSVDGVRVVNLANGECVHGPQ